MRQTPVDVSSFSEHQADTVIKMTENRDSTFDVRSEVRALVYASDTEDFKVEHLVSRCDGQLRVRHRAGDPPYIRIASTGRVWIRFTAIDQTVFTMSDEIFTSLDRPAPLSPEMRAVHEMMRRNEIERERFRSEMFERLENVGKSGSSHNAVLETEEKSDLSGTEAKPQEGAERSGSGSDTAKQTSSKAGKAVLDAAGTENGNRDGGDDSQKDHE